MFSQSSCPLGTNVNLARQAANELVPKAFPLLILSRYPIETAKSCFVPPFSFSIISVNSVIFLLNYFIFFSPQVSRCVRYRSVSFFGGHVYIYIHTHTHTRVILMFWEWRKWNNRGEKKQKKQLVPMVWPLRIITMFLMHGKIRWSVTSV